MRKVRLSAIIASLLPVLVVATAFSVIQPMPGMSVSAAEASTLYGGCQKTADTTLTVCCNGGNTTVNALTDDAAGKKDGTATACTSEVSCTYTPLGDENCGG